MSRTSRTGDVDATTEPVAMGTEIIAGLLLAGGASRRMGRDKAGIDYHGRSQLDHAFDLLREVTGSCLLAIGPGHHDEPLRRGHPCVIDAEGFAGPAAGLIGAQDLRPEVSWLLLACDMPLMPASMLHELVRTAARHPEADVIAYAAADGRIEPLCALWRPAGRARLRTMAATPSGGLRHVAERLQTCLLPPVDAAYLRNANTPDEAADILQQLRQQRDSSTCLDSME